MLSDHIEKLMMFLKHEATQKAKAHEQQRRLQKELELVKVSIARLFQVLKYGCRFSPLLCWRYKLLAAQIIPTPLGRGMCISFVL